MKNKLIVFGLLLIFSLTGCQRYQTFLLYEISEGIESEREASDNEGIEEAKTEDVSTDITQYVLVDKHTGRLYYIKHGNLVELDPN